MTDEEYIEVATKAYASDNVLVQQIAADETWRDGEVVDRVEGGAWVLAWVWVDERDK